MPENNQATLTVRLTTGGGAIPIEGGVVRLSGNQSENESYDLSQLTDRAGIARFSGIPTPDIEGSLSPGAPGPAYYTYTLEIFKEGYFAVIIRNISFFEGIETIQKIDLVPYATFDGQPEYPRDRIVIDSAENTDL